MKGKGKERGSGGATEKLFSTSSETNYLCASLPSILIAKHGIMMSWETELLKDKFGVACIFRGPPKPAEKYLVVS